MPGVEAPTVARPGTAVHDQHQRAGPVAAGSRAGHRPRQVAHQRQAVARCDHHWAHRRQRLPIERGTGAEEVAGRAGAPPVEVEEAWGVVRHVRHDPDIVVQRPADDMQLAWRHAFEVRQVVGHGGIEHPPRLALVGERGSLRHARARVQQHVVQVGAGVLREHGAGAGRDVDRHQRRRVAPAAVGGEERRAGGVEAARLGRQRVLVLDAHELAPTVVAGLEHVHAAVLGHAHGQAHAQIVVADEVREARVFEHQLSLTRLEVDRMDVVVLRVAVVQTDQHAFRVPRAQVQDARLHAGQRRQVGVLHRVHVHAVQAPVLVAAVVLQVQQVVAVVGPLIDADAAA